MIHFKRLRIGPWEEEWAPQFFELTHDKGFNLYPITIYSQKDLGEALDWIKKMRLLHEETSLGKWAVFNESDELIGLGGLSPWKLDGENLIDITYRLRESAWKKGYGKELATALVRHGFLVLGLNEITATVTPDNFPSKELLLKLGFRFDRNIVLLEVPTELYRLSRAESKYLKE